MLTQMITETLLGALTGYVTNHTAIRSLFQPGGVIEHTRDDFASGIKTAVRIAANAASPE